jgi:uncharacterized membrane protein
MDLMDLFDKLNLVNNKENISGSLNKKEGVNDFEISEEELEDKTDDLKQKTNENECLTIKNINNNEVNNIEEINVDDEVSEIKAMETEDSIPNPEKLKTSDIREKTLGSVLNINWEELKKAKAKVTITIDFGD